jgi:hypothetical protein
VRRAVCAAVAREVGLTPSAVVVLEASRLPKTSSGKLRRAQARRMYVAGALEPGVIEHDAAGVRALHTGGDLTRPAGEHGQERQTTT